MDMQAVINISDEGVRLRPLSCVRNGALLNVGSLTIIEHMIRLLGKSGVTKALVICSYMSEGVGAYFKVAESFGVEVELLKTSSECDALKACAEKINEDFIYFSKPVYADFDLSAAVEFHKKKKAFVTVVAEQGIQEGIVSDKTGRVTRVEENRIWSSIAGEQGVGIYIMRPSATEYMTGGDFTRNTLGEIVRSGKAVYIKAMHGIFESTGDVAAYMRACFTFLEEMKKTANGGICVAEGAVVEKGALLEVPCYIGEGAHIHKGAKIGAFSLIGAGCVVSEGASIKRSIISKDCRIGAFATLRGCIFDEEVHVGRDTTVYEQAIVGRRSNIGSDVLIKSFVKIWPEKTIEKGVIVSENIMWGQKKRSKLFEDGRIRGVVNVDITPLFCTLLGSVAGRVFNSGEVGISTDDSASGAMLRDAVAAGLTGAGCSVKDFGEQPLPITRRAAMFYSLKGAVCISVHSVSGEDVAEISIIGKQGFDIDPDTEQKLEELFEKGDVVYPEAKSIKECEYVFEYKLYYLKSIVDYKKEKRRGMKMLLSCPATWGRRLIASAMADFSCPVSMYEGDCESREGQRAFADAVKMGAFDIGFMLDSKCERLYIARNGQIMSEDMYEALYSLIVMKKYPGARIYVPAAGSSVVDTMAEKYGCTVVRTKSTSLEIMRHMAGREEYLSEQFVFRFDAVGSVILIMDYLTAEGLDIGELLNEIPLIAMEKTLIEIPEGKLSDILDKIYDMPEASDAAEGVKITFDKGWVVVIPDVEKEVFKVVSEGASMEIARELCDFCIRKIEEK